MRFASCRHACAGAPHTASPFAASLLRERLRLTYRVIENLLLLADRLRQLLGPPIVPDHSIP